MTHRLAPLMAPRSIAVLGASADPTRIGGVPLKCLVDWGFAGPVYPVNPKYADIVGRRCFPDLESLPESVDLAVVATGADLALAQLREAAARCAVRAAVVYASGFEEAGNAEGAARGAALQALARESGMAVCGPNCMVAPTSRAARTPASFPAWRRRGLATWRW
jgi:acyl-CoA synthetase (NDP forming)